MICTKFVFSPYINLPVTPSTMFTEVKQYNAMTEKWEVIYQKRKGENCPMDKINIEEKNNFQNGSKWEPNFSWRKFLWPIQLPEPLADRLLPIFGIAR